MNVQFTEVGKDGDIVRENRMEVSYANLDKFIEKMLSCGYRRAGGRRLIRIWPAPGDEVQAAESVFVCEW